MTDHAMVIKEHRKISKKVVGPASSSLTKPFWRKRIAHTFLSSQVPATVNKEPKHQRQNHHEVLHLPFITRFLLYQAMPC